jgi:hypothetical protein
MKPLADLLDECDRHPLALREAMRQCPQPLMAAHIAARDPDLVANLD